MDRLVNLAVALSGPVVAVLSRRAVRIALAVGFAAAAFTFIGIRVSGSWGDLSGYFEGIRLGWAVGSLPFVVVAFVAFAYGWTMVLGRMTSKFSTLRLIRVWAQSQMGKYIPGLGVHVAARIELTAAEGIPRRAALLSTSVEIGLLVLTAGIVSLLALSNLSGIGSVWGNGLYALVLIPGFMVAALVISPVSVRWLASRIGGVDTSGFGYRSLGWLVLFNLLRWLVLGVGFFLLARSVFPIGFSDLPYVIGSFALAWAMGLLVVFAPGGFGVREGVLVLLMEQIMPSGAALTLAAVGRLWWIVGELGLLGLSFVAVALMKKLSPVAARKADAVD